jgi:hypothetical protein
MKEGNKVVFWEQLIIIKVIRFLNEQNERLIFSRQNSIKFFSVPYKLLKCGL